MYRLIALFLMVLSISTSSLLAQEPSGLYAGYQASLQSDVDVSVDDGSFISFDYAQINVFGDGIYLSSSSPFSLNDTFNLTNEGTYLIRFVGTLSPIESNAASVDISAQPSYVSGSVVNAGSVIVTEYLLSVPESGVLVNFIARASSLSNVAFGAGTPFSATILQLSNP